MGKMLRSYAPIAVLVALAAVLVGSPSELDPRDLGDDLDGERKLSIRFIEPVEVRPGDAVIAEADGLDPTAGPLTATLSINDQKYPVRVLRVEGERVAVQLPRDLPMGTLKVRLHQGDRKSKPRLLQVRARSVRNLARNVLGGLALLGVGLFLVGRAFRHFASRKLRSQLASMTHSRPRSVGFGAALGAFTQSTTGSVGIMLGMLRAELLHGRAALAVLLGAQLGAATAGALLPFFANREALWWVALGVLMTWLARHRTARAVGHVVLGCGVLFLGLSIMQDGLRPLLSEPALLPFVHDLASARGAAVGLSIGLGAALAALLQGPGPAFVVVAALAQSTTILSIEDGLLILSGCALGNSVGVALLAAPAGTEGRRLALGHGLLGLIFLGVTALGIPLWSQLASSMVQTDASVLRHGTRVLRPNVAGHLSTAFVLSQLAAVAVCLPLLQVIEGLSARMAPRRRLTRRLQGATLLPSMSACRTGLLALRDLIATRDRAPAAVAEEALTHARAAVTEQLKALSATPQADGHDLIGPLTVCLHLTTAADGALRVAERGLERDLVLNQESSTPLREVVELLVEGVSELVEHVEGRRPLARDDMQAREIRINSLEARARSITGQLETLDEAMWVSELCSACEGVGNHLYRLGSTLLDRPAQHHDARSDAALALE